MRGVAFLAGTCWRFRRPGRSPIAPLLLTPHSLPAFPPITFRTALHPLLTTALVFVAAAVLAGDPPAFPGQPHLNGSLKQLNAAKEKFTTDAINYKGTYQTIAKQLIGEAEQELKKGDTDKAGKKIDEAIANVNKAGETGNKEK